MPDHPHISLPFRFEQLRSGEQRLAVTEQDSMDELGDSVELIVRTTQGDRRTLPGFGVSPTLAFMSNHDLARSLTQQAIDDSEPRVQALVQRGEVDETDQGVNRILVMYEVHIPEEDQ